MLNNVRQNINNITYEDKIKLTNLFIKLKKVNIGDTNYRVDSKYDFTCNNTMWDFRAFCGGFFQNKTTSDLDNLVGEFKTSKEIFDMTVDPFINKTIIKYRISLDRNKNGWYSDYRAHKMYRKFRHGVLLY